MMKNKTRIIIAVIVFATISGCRKYEENFLKSLLKRDYKEAGKVMKMKGFDFDRKYPNGLSPLMFVIETERFEMADYMLGKGANINAVNNDLETMLIVYSRAGHYNKIKYLIDRGADVNIVSKGGTALLMATEGGYKSIVEALIKKGADVNAADAYGNTPIIWAKNSKIADLLIQNGARINHVSKYGNNALINLSGFGNYETVNKLVKRGVDVNWANSKGRTALMEAALSGKKEIVDLLLNNGASANAIDLQGNNPILLVMNSMISERKIDIIQTLIKKGADVNVINNDGNSALLIGCKIGDESSVRLLIDNKADVNPRDIKNGETPLISSIQSGSLDIVNILIKRGADVNKPNFDGETPLMIASWYKKGSIVKLLLEKGARIECFDNKKQTALSRTIELMNHVVNDQKAKSEYCVILDLLKSAEKKHRR